MIVVMKRIGFDTVTMVLGLSRILTTSAALNISRVARRGCCTTRSPCASWSRLNFQQPSPAFAAATTWIAADDRGKSDRTMPTAGASGMPC